MQKLKIAPPLALAALVALAGCSKKEPATDAARTPEAPAASAQGPQAHPSPSTATTDVDLSGIAKAEGGKTVAEIFKEKDALANSKVAVRGKVVKVNPDIMGKNWVHVRDGSGENGTNDLTVTSTGELPKVGDTVLVTGTVVLDQDFGMNYQYDVILQDAEIKVE